MANATTIDDARPRRRERRQQVPTLTASALAAHLGLSRQRIATLADIEHVIERLPDGKFNQDGARLKYLRGCVTPRGARQDHRPMLISFEQKPNFWYWALANAKNSDPQSGVEATIDALAAIVTTHLALRSRPQN